jgi:hypothetical protein
LVAFAFVVAELSAWPDVPDEPPALCPPTGTTTISKASMLANHRRNEVTGVREVMTLIPSL